MVLKWIRAAVLACLLGMAPARAAGPIDVVFDLDWTLLYTTSPAAVAMDPRDVFEFGGTSYRFSEDAVQVLRALHDNPAYRVSFLSGGDADRNQKALELLYQKINADGVQRAPFKMGSIGDLKPTGAPESAPFTDRFKKDLDSFLPDFDPRRTVIVDDSKGFSLPGQERNMLWMQRTYDDIPDHSRRSELSIDPKYMPADFESWRRERKKLLWSYGVIEEARLLSESGGGDFTEALQRLNVDRDSPAGDEMIARSLQRLRRPASAPCSSYWPVRAFR